MRSTTALKGALVCQLLEKLAMDPGGEMDSYWPISNLPILGKAIKCAVALQLQGFPEATDYLDPFQSSFRSTFGMEVALFSLVDNLSGGDLDRESASLLILNNLSAAFNAIGHGIILDRLSELGLGRSVLC